MLPPVDTVHEWTYNVFELTTSEMIALATGLLHWAGVDTYLGVSLNDLHAFCVQVEAEYNDVAYHNFRHGVCVMHVTYLILHGLENVHIDIHHRSALLIAALCHDAKHDGMTNAFHVAAKSSLYERFPVSSPQERLHAATAKELIERCKLLQNLSTSQAENIQQLVESLILATDMNLHQQVLANAASEPQHVESIAQLILHCADISNPIMTMDMSRRWAKCLIDEFTMQIGAERSLGLPLSTYMMAAPNSREEARLHIGFIERYAAEAWRLLVEILANNSELFATCLSNLVANEKYWRLKAADRWRLKHSDTNVVLTCVESLQAA
ncbi:hypothetical protein THRCLA_02153 [Thraustotheca clavata]|uniref:PDEase domain-containing protein n=1 Tax=Thraustotheca clavata TaxID=74557 RepID=A0A1W0A636_9STRA|nr:hypothetical protein THRCLA_02153 [Thraustotheca clavata]